MKCIENVTKKIAAKQPVIGTHVKWGNSTAVDILCRNGFDYVWIDGEHGAMDIENVYNHVRAAQMNGVAVFYRVLWSDPALCKPVLEMGVDGIIFPMICNRKDAEKAVASVLYPPEGIRGFGPGMINDYGNMPLEEYFEKAKKIWKIVQIEHVDAVENIDEILSTEGVDAAIVGMYDLSGSMGILAQLQHPELLKKLDYIAEKCKEYGKPFGSSISYNETLLSQWFARGASFMTIGGDQDFVAEGARHAVGGASAIFNEKFHG